MITAKFALTPIEFLGVHPPPATSQQFVRHDGVKHFVMEHVFQKPPRHECLIEQGMDTNHPVFFLDRSKNEMVFRAMFSAPSPFHVVITKPAAKIALVQLIKDLTEIEVVAFLAKIKLSLHRQRAIRDLALRFLRHNGDPGWKDCNSKWVRTGRQEKRFFFLLFSLSLLLTGVYASSESGRREEEGRR